MNPNQIKDLIAVVVGIVAAGIVAYIPELQSAEGEIITLITGAILLLLVKATGAEWLALLLRHRAVMAQALAISMDAVEKVAKVDIPDHLEEVAVNAVKGK